MVKTVEFTTDNIGENVENPSDENAVDLDKWASGETIDNSQPVIEEVTDITKMLVVIVIQFHHGIADLFNYPKYELDEVGQSGYRTIFKYLIKKYQLKDYGLTIAIISVLSMEASMAMGLIKHIRSGEQIVDTGRGARAREAMENGN